MPPVDAGIQLASGAAPSPTFTDLEAFTVRLGRTEWHIFDDGSKPVPIPNSDTIEFAWPHVLALVVNNSSPGVVITNRRLRVSHVDGGLKLWYGVLSAYRQSIEGYTPDPVASAGTPTPKGAGAPGSYTQLTIGSEVMYDNTPQEALAGVNGAYLELVFGARGLFGTGSVINITAYQARMTWDER